MGRRSVSTELVIDIDELEYLPAKTILKLVEHSQKVTKALKEFKQTVSSVGPLFRSFEEMDIDLQFNPDGGYIAFCFTGDGERLAAVWKELRRNGYKSDCRPKKGDTTFYAFWEREGYARLFMNFSSSMCRRVQVGTKMVEQPIYETQCGDLPELETDAPKPNLTVIEGGFDDDVPF
jgi:hypothetical protein